MIVAIDDEDVARRLASLVLVDDPISKRHVHSSRLPLTPRAADTHLGQASCGAYGGRALPASASSLIRFNSSSLGSGWVPKFRPTGSASSRGCSVAGLPC